MKEETTVQASGEIGEVYTTPTGLNLVDEEVHSVGWMQVSATSRKKVVLTMVSGHCPYSIWLKEKK